jgi:hypothetical protein
MRRKVKAVPVFNEAHRGKLWENGGITPLLTSTLDVAEWPALFVALCGPSVIVGRRLSAAVRPDAMERNRDCHGKLKLDVPRVQLVA